MSVFLPLHTSHIPNLFVAISAIFRAIFAFGFLRRGNKWTSWPLPSSKDLLKALLNFCLMALFVIIEINYELECFLLSIIFKFNTLKCNIFLIYFNLFKFLQLHSTSREKLHRTKAISISISFFSDKSVSFEKSVSFSDDIQGVPKAHSPQHMGKSISSMSLKITSVWNFLLNLLLFSFKQN
jgi:hypothetical protein